MSMKMKISPEPAYVLTDRVRWVAKDARPISLRQLMVFGRRSLTEARLISSANYVRTELPTRLAHRIRDMQTLPYVVVTNPHMSQVYELYYKAFENFRRLREIKTLDDNEHLCKVISNTLQEHLTVIPKLAMGGVRMSKSNEPIGHGQIHEHNPALENIATGYCRATPSSHRDLSLALALPRGEASRGGFLGREVQALMSATYGPSTIMPEIRLAGHLESTFPYILSHLEYIIGELLRNSVQAVVEKQARGRNRNKPPPPIDVTICEAPQHVIIRVSDQGGGIPRDILPYLWAFSKGPRSNQRLENLIQVPKMAATMQELRVTDAPPSPQTPEPAELVGKHAPTSAIPHETSLSSLTSRPPNLRLGMGLPLSRVYAEYWAGSLEVHSLEGYGCDAFLQISKLGNKNEQLTTRASMDAILYLEVRRPSLLIWNLQCSVHLSKQASKQFNHEDHTLHHCERIITSSSSSSKK
ncbi:hypothetical protein EYC84_011504 [Monilinia fructicola]|uniref:Protein-serine/threonine kinase n=1 Tax=Monilinia fructicola TaxID=38448 RepID=A0A5M9J9M4_MONFR|nr:hypothetical protein EYC84_011504 [Monilinia fructicola]